MAILVSVDHAAVWDLNVARARSLTPPIRPQQQVHSSDDAATCITTFWERSVRPKLKLGDYRLGASRLEGPAVCRQCCTRPFTIPGLLNQAAPRRPGFGRECNNLVIAADELFTAGETFLINHYNLGRSAVVQGTYRTASRQSIRLGTAPDIPLCGIRSMVGEQNMLGWEALSESQTIHTPKLQERFWNS